MVRKTGQVIHCGRSTWLVCIYVGRDPENRSPAGYKYDHNFRAERSAARSGRDSGPGALPANSTPSRQRAAKSSKKLKASDSRPPSGGNWGPCRWLC